MILFSKLYTLLELNFGYSIVDAIFSFFTEQSYTVLPIFKGTTTSFESSFGKSCSPNLINICLETNCGAVGIEMKSCILEVSIKMKTFSVLWSQSY